VERYSSREGFNGTLDGFPCLGGGSSPSSIIAHSGDVCAARECSGSGAWKLNGQMQFGPFGIAFLKDLWGFGRPRDIVLSL